MFNPGSDITLSVIAGLTKRKVMITHKKETMEKQETLSSVYIKPGAM